MSNASGPRGRHRARPRFASTLRHQRMNGEVVAFVAPGCDALPSGTGRVAAEQFHRIFVAVLGVDGFAAAELERLAADPDALARKTREMHLNPALVLIVEGAVAEI